MLLNVVVQLWQGLMSLIALLMSYAAESKLVMALFSCTLALLFLLNVQSGSILCSQLMKSMPDERHRRRQCSTGRQLDKELSPINIERSSVCQQMRSRPLNWSNYCELPLAVLLENNGSTVIMRIACSPPYLPHLSGAELQGNYYFVEASFKWGLAQSEHSIDSYKFSLEMQVLHRSNLMDAPSEYLTVSYLFAIAHHNQQLGQIADNLKSIVRPGSCIELPPFDIGSLLRPFDGGYYSYIGTYDNGARVLPTRWLIYSRIFSMSQEQQRQFADLCRTDGGRILQNARLEQPVGNRCVQYHI